MDCIVYCTGAHFSRVPPSQTYAVPVNCWYSMLSADWHAKSLLCCAGYQYSYPFLEGLDIVRTADSQVKPLYRSETLGLSHMPCPHHVLMRAR